MAAVNAASLNVLVDVDSKKAVGQLDLFDKRLRKSAGAAETSTGKVTASQGDLQGALKKTAVQSDKTSKTMVKSSKDIDQTTKSTKHAKTEMGELAAAIGFAGRSIELLKFPSLIAGAGYATSAITTLTGGVVALTGALAPLAGTATGVGTALTTAFQVKGTLALAGIKDVTSAVGGLNEKMDESADAFKQLSPEAQKFARSLNDLKGPLKELQGSIQEPLFSGLSDGIDSAMKNMPALNKVLTSTAGSLGYIARKVGDFVGSKGFGSDFTKIGLANTRFLRQMGDALIDVAKAFTDVMVVARPLTKFMTDLTTKGAAGLKDMVAQGRSSGGLADFFKKTEDVVRDLVAMFRNLGGALWNIMKLGAPLGREIIDRLRAGARHLREWTESTEGKHSIADYFKEIKKPLMETGKLLTAFTESFFRIGHESTHLLTPMLKVLRKELLPAIEDLVAGTTEHLGPHLIDLLVSLTKAFANLAGTSGPLEIWVQTMTTLTDALNWLIDNVAGFKEVIVTLLGMKAVKAAFDFTKITGGLKMFIGFLPGMAVGLTSMQASLVGVAYSMGLVEAGATGLSLSLKGLMVATGIGALVVVAGLIVMHWKEVKAVLADVWGWIKGAAGTIYQAIKPGLDAIKNAFLDVFNFVKDHLVLFGIAFGPLGVGIALIIKNFDKFKAVVTTVFHAIVDAGEWAWNALKVAAGVYWDYLKVITLPLRVALETFFKMIKVAGTVAWTAIKGAAFVLWNYLKFVTLPLRVVLEAFFKHIKEIGSTVWNVIKFAAKVLWEYLKIATLPLRTIFKVTFGILKSVATTAFNVVKAVASPVIHWLSGAWDKVSGAVRDAFGWIKNAGRDAFQWLRTAFSNVGDFITGVWDGIKRAFSSVVRFILGGVSTILDKIGDMLGTLGDISIFGKDLVPGADAASDALHGVADNINNYRDTLENAAKSDALSRTFDIPKKKAQELVAYMDRHPSLGANEALKQMDKASKHTTDGWVASNQKVQTSSKETSKDVSQKTGQMDTNVSKSYDHMSKAGVDAQAWLGEQTNHILEALGVKKAIKFNVQTRRQNEPSSPAGNPNNARGGFTASMVPGAYGGDRVPVSIGGKQVANVEPGELVSVTNKKATAALMNANAQVPRYAHGGVAGGLDFALGPYTVPPIEFDPNHAGGNSHVHISGTTIPWVIAIGHQLQQMGNQVGEFGGPASAGFGPITTSAHAHYAHDHYSGYAIDVNSGNEDRAWVASIAEILGGSGVAAAVVEKLIAPVIEGPKGAMQQMVQGTTDKVTAAANAYIQAHAPTETGGASGYVSGGGGPVVQQMGSILAAQQFSQAGAAGIIGNAKRESLWNPASVGTGGGGLFGFTTSPISLADLHTFAQQQHKPWDDVGLQMQFMLSATPASLDTMPDLMGFLKSTSDIDAATTRFMLEWERPGIPALSDRIAGAHEAMGMIAPSFQSTGHRAGKKRGGVVLVGDSLTDGMYQQAGGFPSDWKHPTVGSMKNMQPSPWGSHQVSQLWNKDAAAAVFPMGSNGTAATLRKGIKEVKDRIGPKAGLALMSLQGSEVDDLSQKNQIIKHAGADAIAPWASNYSGPLHPGPEGYQEMQRLVHDAGKKAKAAGKKRFEGKDRRHRDKPEHVPLVGGGKFGSFSNVFDVGKYKEFMLAVEDLDNQGLITQSFVDRINNTTGMGVLTEEGDAYAGTLAALKDSAAVSQDRADFAGRYGKAFLGRAEATPPGVDPIGWLNLELAQLWWLRKNVIQTDGGLAKGSHVLKQLLKEMDKNKGWLDKVGDRITEIKEHIARLEKDKVKLNKDLKDADTKKGNDNAAIQKKIDAEKKKPKKKQNQNAIDRWQQQLKEPSSEHDAVQAQIDAIDDELKPLNKKLKTYQGLYSGIDKPIRGALTTRQTNVGAGREFLQTELDSLQGAGLGRQRYNDQIPPVGTLYGQIGDLQLQLQDFDPAFQTTSLGELRQFAEQIRYEQIGQQANYMGAFAKGGVALVGENGPELAAMPSGTRITSAKESRELLSPQFDVNVYIGGEKIDERVEVVIDRRDKQDGLNARAGVRL